MNNIIKNWNENKILGGFDCLSNKSGTVILLTIIDQNASGTGNILCKPFCETTIESIVKYNNELWCYFDIFSNTIELKNGDKIFGGEGEMGSHGFIVSQDSNNNFNWSLYFLKSNPFYKIDTKENSICAYTSSDYVYTIDINNPAKISIGHCEWR